MHTLTEADAERIEDIWQELSGGLEDGEEQLDEEVDEDDEAFEAQVREATQRALGPGAHAEASEAKTSSALERLRENSKQVRLTQRLQRARSGSMGAKPSAVPSAMAPDEVGCLIHPL